MAKRSMINLCVCCAFGVSPAHVYKGGRRRRPALEGARQVWGVLLGLPSPSRTPLFLSGVGEKKEGKREGLPRAGRAPPQGLVRIGLGVGAPPPPSFSSLFPFLDSYSYYMEGGESYSRWE